MNPSRILPTAAFGVAVSTFFLPPLMAAGGLPGKPTAPAQRLEVQTREDAKAPHVIIKKVTRSADFCGPADTPAAKLPPAEPMRPWPGLVAALHPASEP